MFASKTGGRAVPVEGRAGVVTALVPKGGQAERVAVYLDGRFALELAGVVAGEAGLSRGDVLGEERQTLLLERDAGYRAQDLALSMLARRELSRREVAAKLQQAGLGDEVVEGTLSWLEERGYVDDRRFASAYMGERLKAGWGRRRIAAELLKKGVAGEIVRGEAWDEVLQEQGLSSEGEAAVALARKRFGGLLAADPETGKRRLAGFLARRGHDWEDIAKITRLVCADVDSTSGVRESRTGVGEGERRGR